MSTEDTVVTSCAERPELIPRIFEISAPWPEFVLHDPVSDALFGQIAREFPELCVVATVGDRVIARGHAVPFAADLPGRTAMPDRGWDEVLVWAFEDLRQGRPTNLVSALEIVVDREYLGQGLSPVLLGALRTAVRAQGYPTLIVPVRPNGKPDHPRLPMTDYLRLHRDDGLPTDPWLRVHVRAGGTVERIAVASMVVHGSLQEWRHWTGLPFDHDGPVDVPGALVPVHCDTTHGYAVYVEPNVWVRHDLTRGEG